jgi:TolB-like protein
VLPEPATARFELRCWGEFALFDRQRGEDCSPRGRKARAVIAYLATQGPAASRTRLAGLLWSERGEDQARASLRQMLLELKPFATDEARLLVIERDQVHLQAMALTSDIARLEGLARTGDLDALAQALAEKDERLFAGLDGLDPALDEWLARQRRVQQDRMLALGVAALARGLERGAFGEVSRLAAELQALDETDEAVAQNGMKADQALGDYSAVRRRHRRLAEALKAELGVVPSAETEALVAELSALEGGARAASEPASLAQAAALSPLAGERPSIAVLPFVARSGLAADELFAEGVVEDLAAALSTTRWVRVVAASAAAVYRQGARPLRQIGRDLGARYLLEGNVRRVGEILRIGVQLIEAESENILWTQKFDRPIAQLPVLHEDMVEEMAAHLGAQVRRQEMQNAVRKPASSTSWEAYVRAMSQGLFRYPTRSSYEAGVAAARQAVDIDPSDGPGYAVLASMQGQLLHHSGGDDPELAREIEENIRKARALDPDNPVALTGVAAAFIGLRRPEEGVPPAKRAVAMTPNDDAARHMLGALYARLGRLDEAIAELDAGDRLAPDGAWAYLSALNRSIGYLLDGQLGVALAAAEETARLLPGPELLLQTMLCLARLGRWDGARETLHRLGDTNPEMSRAIAEGVVRSLYCASPASADYAAIVGKVWDGC